MHCFDNGVTLLSSVYNSLDYNYFFTNEQFDVLSEIQLLKTGKMPLGDGNDESSVIKDPLREFIDNHIKSDDVVIFSRTTCRYCDMVKNIFNKMNYKYTAVELDDRPDYDDLKMIFQEMTGECTVPRVFVKGESIGGAWRTNMLFVNGLLHKKLGIKEPLNRHMEAHIDL